MDPKTLPISILLALCALLLLCTPFSAFAQTPLPEIAAGVGEALQVDRETLDHAAAKDLQSDILPHKPSLRPSCGLRPCRCFYTV
jgi:hypothetical protein